MSFSNSVHFSVKSDNYLAMIKITKKYGKYYMWRDIKSATEINRMI